MPTEVYWKPVYKSPSWLWEAERTVMYHALVDVGVISPRARFTGITVQPSGRLCIGGQVLPFASVEEAKEVGMAMYLLTQEGG